MVTEKIACCVDFSVNAEAAFKTAIEMARTFHAKLYVVHVLPLMVHPLVVDTEWILPERPRESLISDVTKRVQQEYGHKLGDDIYYELIVLEGHVSSKIIGFLEEKDVDLAIMGSYGASGMGLVIFGSVAKRVARKAPCSVMIVREKV